MKDIVVIDSEKNITKSDIYLLEAKLGINLPIEYKDFLLLKEDYLKLYREKALHFEA